jgi:hypothetical protein
MLGQARSNRRFVNKIIGHRAKNAQAHRDMPRSCASAQAAGARGSHVRCSRRWVAAVSLKRSFDSMFKSKDISWITFASAGWVFPQNRSWP